MKAHGNLEMAEAQTQKRRPTRATVAEAVAAAPQQALATRPVPRRRPPPRRSLVTVPPDRREEAAVAKRKAKFLKKLREEWGNITLAAEKTNIGRTTVYAWRDADKEFRTALDAMNEIAIDMYENELKKTAQAGNAASSMFFLKCKAKHRGYVERLEHTGQGGGPITSIVARVDMPDEQLRSSINRIMQDDEEFRQHVIEGGTLD